MGIELEHPVANLNETEFHRLDYSVMSCAFDLYNSIGNLWDEADYQQKLMQRCKEKGLSVFAESSIKVSYQDFTKLYYIDLLIEGGVYELKTSATIAAQHESQSLNYLFLTATHHGKIINFRPDSLEWRFVSTTLSPEQRKKINLTTAGWKPTGGLKLNIADLLSDLSAHWGAYLDIHLYKEAVLHFLGIHPEDPNKRFVPITENKVIHFTCLSRKQAAYVKNLEKYLQASSYQQIDWINLNRNQISIQSLCKK